jgi:hypothetical protein
MLIFSEFNFKTSFVSIDQNSNVRHFKFYLKIEYYDLLRLKSAQSCCSRIKCIKDGSSKNLQFDNVVQILAYIFRARLIFKDDIFDELILSVILVDLLRPLSYKITQHKKVYNKQEDSMIYTKSYVFVGFFGFKNM